MSFLACTCRAHAVTNDLSDFVKPAVHPKKF